MAILESGEMYVETIYLLSLESDKVREKTSANTWVSPGHPSAVL